MSNSARHRPSGDTPVKPVRVAAKTGKTRTAAAAVAAGTDKSVKQPATAKSPGGARRRATSKLNPTGVSKAKLSSHELHPLIAEAAYLIAEREGFPPGRELEHWLQAETLILERIESD